MRATATVSVLDVPAVRLFAIAISGGRMKPCRWMEGSMRRVKVVVSRCPFSLSSRCQPPPLHPRRLAVPRIAPRPECRGRRLRTNATAARRARLCRASRATRISWGSTRARAPAGSSRRGRTAPISISGDPAEAHRLRRPGGGPSRDGGRRCQQTPTHPTATAWLATAAMIDPWESVKVNPARQLLGGGQRPLGWECGEPGGRVLRLRHLCRLQDPVQKSDVHLAGGLSGQHRSVGAGRDAPTTSLRS